MKNAAWFFCFFVFFSVSSFSLDFNDPENPEILARSIVEAMTDEEALAQLFMFGWKEWESGPEPAITEWIKRRNLGGVKVFGWNSADTERLAQTISGFQKLSVQSRFNIPLLVATDQEGGLVRHVKGQTSQTPGSMAIGASGFPEDAYRSGLYIGKELRVLGINMNFAPTVDLYTNHGSVLIGPRSFGDVPENAGLFGIAFARGQEKAGIIPTAKHFPGHGDTALDSHGVLPEINAPFDVLWERELVPYRMLAKNGVPAIMSGHIAFPQTQSKDTPASLSPWFLQTILREKIGFNGLIITDDLMMNGAIMSAGSLSRAARQAILAGNDVIMTSQTPALDEAVWVSLLYSVKNDEVFSSRVRESAFRVLLVKLRYLKDENAAPLYPDLKEVRESLPGAEGSVFFQDLAARSVTVIKNSNETLPLSVKNAGSVLLAGQNLDFFALGKRTFDGAAAYWYTAPVNGDLMRRAQSSDTIILYLSNEEGIQVLRSFRPLGKRIIVLSVLSPALLEQASWVDAAVAVYSDSYESLVAGFSALAGRFNPSGSLPFKLKH
ncbi:MAG: glycoside hydrolase family 3 protein [Spirochaetaceae bacterium]|jgi:beta-N-acetylhexosaminidase|nr:glycoside hydrolase family 3 protein [Spirochaetaceae bacterium]